MGSSKSCSYASPHFDQPCSIAYNTLREDSKLRHRAIFDTTLLFLYFITAFGAAVIITSSLFHYGASATCSKPLVRREWRSLNAHEKEEYISAAKCMYNASSQLVGEGSVQDDFTWVHLMDSGAAHEDASFLPWHRMFVHIYEQKLREQCGFQGQLPYWDWSEDWQNLTKSSIWNSTNGFGGEGRDEEGCVSGPFGDVQVRYKDNGTVSPHCLTRSFLNYDSGEVGSMSGDLIKPERMGRLARAEDYGVFRYILEGTLHNVIHLEVTGDLDELSAPNDPIFWLHHVQLDRLWWQWQQEDPARLQDYGQYKKQPGRNVSLHDTLQQGGLVDKNILVHQVMDTESGILCYRY
ncbi:hypothetical protein F5Y19DRAFT_453990 [Xylariaceae sp. FL1651]|nr:hypothetical protein F5Y19DRAFT_453990 [Xylariaceae sp. FL1651]